MENIFLVENILDHSILKLNLKSNVTNHSKCMRSCCMVSNYSLDADGPGYDVAVSFDQRLFPKIYACASVVTSWFDSKT